MKIDHFLFIFLLSCPVLADDTLPFEKHEGFLSLKSQDFAHAWSKSSIFGGAADLLVLSQVASHPNCRPGSYLDAARFAYSSLYEFFADPFGRGKPRPEKAAILAQIEKLEAKLTPEERQVLYSGMIPGKNSVYIPYACDASHPWKNVASPGLARDSVARGRNFPQVSYYCSDYRAMRFQPELEATSSIAKNAVIEIELQNPQNFALDRIKFVKSIFSAMEVWRSQCFACKKNSAVVIRFDGEGYISQSLSPSTLSLPFGRKPNPPFRVDQMLVTMIRSTSRFRDRGEMTVSRIDPVDEFCRLQLDMSDQATADVASALECQGAPARVPEATKLVVRLASKTSCPALKGVIACAVAGKLVEFDADDFVFEDEFGEAVFGNGDRRVELNRAMVHEAGHWLGMSHHEDRESVMNPTLNNSICINNETVYRLNAAVSAGKPVATGHQALMYTGK